MGEFSLTHILILGIILTIFLGPGRLPGVAKGLGEAIRDFKKSLNGEDQKQADRIEQEKEKQKPS
jgi:sec-independent protein translocase protein TatA